MENYVGKKLDGRYEVQEIIGVGGMAVVYKAYDSIDDRVVAIKILKEEYLANEEFRRRFKNESRAIAVLSHPNIVKVYDVSYGDKLQYIVMEYVEGITLKEYIEKCGKVNWKEAVHFITQILRALQNAHDKGIIHRDVKPQNIMLLQNGTIKVTDFGIARFWRSENRTVTERAIGSVHYISPEQARGDITDNKTDIYSVGIVLYEMLTGQLPFQADNSVAVAIMQTQAEPKPPREINDTIPPGLEQITLKAMSKSLQERYQSAAEMLLDIEEFKRNPSVKFEHAPFIDSQPTKTIKKNNQGIPPANVVNHIENQVDEPDVPRKKSVLPIVIGIGSGLAVLAVIIIVLLSLFTDLIGPEKLEVPNFIGKSYEEEIKNNDEYSEFTFVPEYVQNSTYEDGVVFSQDPQKGTKIKKDDKITLSIAEGTKLVVIPPIYNLDYGQAQTALKNLGFTVTVVPEIDMSKKFGTVLRTSPEQGVEAPEGSNVIIYYASDEDLVEVPDLVGWDIASARSLLASLGLELSNEVTTQDSAQTKGEIIAQSIEKGKKVPAGTSVAVTVSSGIPPEATVKISIDLPDFGSVTFGTVIASLNNEEVFSKNVLLDGSAYSFDVKGSGATNSLKVFVNSSLLYECKIDFTKPPANMISGEKKYEITTTSPVIFRTVPNVVGQSESAAKASLAAKGFENVSVEYKATGNLAEDGIVLKQKPVYDIIKKYTLDTEIVLTVGLYEAPPTTASP
ncbi:MAG TPA: Stk1 family PASTA domain-containing Ser/Thr kinase [Clostridiales bacterium]|nr:Stk1 family PASTA domain-containing Ser/Thr kinase [Clostridiales bacterium]